MTNKDTQATDREALARLLEIHGADRTRWPARERLRFAGVISEDKAAAKLLAEAAALDRLLDQAPRASDSGVEALKERIMAAALRTHEPHLAVIAGGKKIAVLPQAQRGRRSLPGRSLAGRFVEWPAAAVLAASLVLGVMLGTTGTVETTMQEVAQAAGFGSGTSDTAQLALGDDALGQIDEDLL
jgi:molybdopterin converting factor small subunit